MAKDDEILKEELEAFDDAVEAEKDNRARALEALRFNRLGEQWPENIKRDRELQNRPMLTLNHMPAFIRQVVNDSRQNKPQITVKPVDDDADIHTANVYKGLIKTIETQSKADVAYDTAVDFAASCGIGYIRVAIEHEHDDTFDLGLRIQPIYNPFSVYADPNAKSMDGSDWNKAFITDLMTKSAFKAKYKGAEEVDWAGSGYDTMAEPWRQDDLIQVAESWTRDEAPRQIVLLSDGSVIGADEYKANKDLFDAIGLTVTNSRTTRSFKVIQRIMSGKEILETNNWAGRYIPVVPVLGEEINIEGKRTFLSMVHHAMDSQRMMNYWRTTATELVALSPRVPYIGEQGAFDIDPEKWASVNTAPHAYLEVARGKQIPQRQPLDTGTAAGAMSQALQANDDMKAMIGLYDASLGNRSNETSGIAINSRKHEGDISTFHIQDNLSRSIRQIGCILVDLIPSVYGNRQMLRILGDDGTQQTVQQGTPPEGQPPAPPQLSPMQKLQGVKSSGLPHPETGLEHVYDLSAGKYDVVVDTGPSYTTRREQTAAEMANFLKAYPQAAPLLGDIFVKSLDWPQSDEIAERLRSMIPAQATGGLPPELAQQIQQGQQHIQDLTNQLQQAQQQVQAKDADRTAEMQQKAIDAYNAETNRLKVLAPLMTPETLSALGLQAEQQALAQSSPVEPPAPTAPLQINIPDNLGESITNAVGPAIHQAVHGGMQKALEGFKMPPPPAMKRTAVRDPNTNLITHTIDEPIGAETPQQ